MLINTPFIRALLLSGVFTLPGCNDELAETVSDSAASPAAVSGEAGASNQPPNVLVVLADDLGYTDLGFMGGEIDTPNLDMLAATGTIFSNFYSAPTCSPTRAMLLSGTDPHTAGLGNMAATMAPNQVGHPGYEGYLNDSVVSLASMLRDAGYQTYMSGKWHLGMTEELSPAARGFDRSFVLTGGGGGHFDHLGLFGGRGSKALYREDGKVVSLPVDFYSSKSYVDKMIGYLEHKNDDKPFFAYLAFSAPHWPLQAPASAIKKYKGHYDKGYAELHAQRLARLKALGFLPQTMTINASQLKKTWEGLSEADKRSQARKMEVYAAMVDQVDVHLGRLLDYLERIGERDNTVIVFMSDNGAEGHDIDQMFGGSVIQDWITQCCDNTYENIGNYNSYVWTGPHWAQASSIPSRLYKGYPTEGGIRVPAFVNHPATIEAGKVSNELASVMDIFPTVLDIAKAWPIAAGSQRPNVAATEGRTLLPYLQGTSSSVRTAGEGIGWELFGRRAYRQGPWKILSMYTVDAGPGKWSLYNLENNPSESQDLSSDFPDKLTELIALWDAYGSAHGVILPDKVLPGI